VYELDTFKKLCLAIFMRQTASRNGALKMTESQITQEQIIAYREQRDALNNLLMDVAQGRPSEAVSAFYDFKNADRTQAVQDVNAYLDLVQERLDYARTLIRHLGYDIEDGVDKASEREAAAFYESFYKAQLDAKS
jgi:hypothetical protein